MDRETINALILKLWDVEEHLKAITRYLTAVEDAIAELAEDD